jgi:PAS domain S-box-containing protein
MKRMNESNEDLRGRIEKMLSNRQTSKDVDNRSLEKLIHEVNICHHELELQNDELMRIQSELEISRKYYLELFEQAPIGYVIYDESLAILSANEMFYKLTGAKKAEVINQSITKFIHPDSQDTFYFHNNKLWKTRESSNCEILLNARDNYLPVEIDSSFYHHESQTYIRSALIDLTLIKRNEDRLHKEVARAERSDKLKSVFLNNLSHEIRTPLNAIVGFSEFLNEEGLDREQIQHLTGVIRQSSDQLLDIIEEIVSISTIEAGLTDLFVTETNLGELMNDIHEKFLSKAKLKEIKFRLNNRLSENELFS